MGLYNGFSVEQCEHTIRQQSTKGICDDALQFCQFLNFSYQNLSALSVHFHRRIPIPYGLPLDP